MPQDTIEIAEATNEERYAKCSTMSHEELIAVIQAKDKHFENLAAEYRRLESITNDLEKALAKRNKVVDSMESMLSVMTGYLNNENAHYDA